MSLLPRHGCVKRKYRGAQYRLVRAAACWLLLSLLIAPVVAWAASLDGLIASPEPDWPQWRGPRRDGISSEKGLLSSWPEGGPKPLWKTGGLGTGWSSPIIKGQRLYITGDLGNDLIIFSLNLDG